jgi:topoisomerase IA-like protein
MPTIDDLKKSVSEMTDEELLDLVNARRGERMTPKKPARKVAADKKKMEKRVNDIADNILASITPEELEKLRGALMKRMGKC